LWCFWYWYWMCIDARRPSDCLCFSITQMPWRALSNSWFRVSGCCSCSKDLVTLLVG
jgi:hypothetical protein